MLNIEHDIKCERNDQFCLCTTTYVGELNEKIDYLQRKIDFLLKHVDHKQLAKKSVEMEYFRLERVN